MAWSRGWGEKGEWGGGGIGRATRIGLPAVEHLSEGWASGQASPEAGKVKVLASHWSLPHFPEHGLWEAKVLLSQACLALGKYPVRIPSPWVLQARIMEWVTIPFSRRSSWRLEFKCRDRTQVS